MPEEPLHPTLARANALLAEHFERLVGDSGHGGAAEDLKAIVGLGVEKIVARSKGRVTNEGIRHVLSKVATGRTDLLVEEIAADVQDMAKQRGEQFLYSVKTRHGTLYFLPDVFIPMQVPVFKAWQKFLNGLDPACLRVEDPVTRLRGRIPFRAGQWLGHLGFEGNSTAAIVEDVTEILGDLRLRGHALDPGHTVTVGGALYADLTQLRDEPSFIDILGGALRVYGEGLRGPADLDLAPDELTDWGAGHGTLVVLNDGVACRLLVEEGPDGPVHALAEVSAGKELDLRSERFVWKDSGWRRFTRVLPPETAYDLLRQFRRACAILGMGEDFVQEQRDSAKTVEVNVGRIAVLLALARGEHSAHAREAVPQLARDRIESLEKDLLRLRALVVGEGPEYYRDMKDVEKDIKALLDGMGDNRLRRLHKDLTSHCRRIPRGKIRQDREYLARLAEEGGLTFGDVLGTAGRTLVFLNNLCRSRQARRLAADTVGRVRAALKEVTGGKEDQSLLLTLLKFQDKETVEELRAAHKDKGPAVVALTDILGEIEARKPLEVVREFRMNRYKKDEPELAGDKALLSRILGMHKGTLDEVFARADRGHGLEEGRILQNALLANLQSFIAEDVKARPIDLDREKPSHVVAQLLEKLERYRPVMAEYNRLCAGGSEQPQ